MSPRVIQITMCDSDVGGESDQEYGPCGNKIVQLSSGSHKSSEVTDEDLPFIGCKDELTLWVMRTDKAGA